MADITLPAKSPARAAELPPGTAVAPEMTMAEIAREQCAGRGLVLALLICSVFWSAVAFGVFALQR